MFMYSKLLKITVIKNYKILIMISKILKTLQLKALRLLSYFYLLFSNQINSKTTQKLIKFVKKFKKKNIPEKFWNIENENKKTKIIV